MSLLTQQCLLIFCFNPSPRLLQPSTHSTASAHARNRIRERTQRACSP